MTGSSTGTWRAVFALLLLAALAGCLALALRWFGRQREWVGRWVAARWQRAMRSARFRGAQARFPRTFAFAAARFSRAEYLGLHLTLGLTVSLAAALGFAAVTEDVVTRDSITATDVRVAGWFRAHATPWGDALGVLFSTIGSPLSWAIIAAVVALVLVLRRRWIWLGGWVAAIAGAGLIAEAIKLLIKRPRPPGAERFLHGNSFSFPSGHATGSLVGFGMLAYLLIALWEPARRRANWTVAVAAVLAFAIGLARLYLAVHYLSDVVAGYAAGGVWLAACITGVEIAIRQRGIEPLRLGGGARSEEEAARSR